MKIENSSEMIASYFGGGDEHTKTLALNKAVEEILLAFDRHATSASRADAREFFSGMAKNAESLIKGLQRSEYDSVLKQDLSHGGILVREHALYKSHPQDQSLIEGQVWYPRSSTLSRRIEHYGAKANETLCSDQQKLICWFTNSDIFGECSEVEFRSWIKKNNATLNQPTGTLAVNGFLDSFGSDLPTSIAILEHLLRACQIRANLIDGNGGDVSFSRELGFPTAEALTATFVCLLWERVYGAPPGKRNGRALDACEDIWKHASARRSLMASKGPGVNGWEHHLDIAKQQIKASKDRTSAKAEVQSPAITPLKAHSQEDKLGIDHRKTVAGWNALWIVESILQAML